MSDRNHTSASCFESGIRQFSNRRKRMRASSKHGEPKAQPMIDSAPAPLTVALDLRTGLLTFSTFVSVALVAGITVVFHYGVQLGLYDGSTMSQKKRDDLLDTYNGYSGNIASALGRPLEFFIAIMAQVFVIRFFTASLLRPQPKWYLGVVAMTVSVVLGFFLNNGLNALNVQLRDHDIQAKINASDLAFQPNSSLVSDYLAKTSNITRTFSERQPRNPVTNTILRNLVLPRTPKVQPQCKVTYSGMRFPEDIVDYGFPQREWMQNLLPEALDAKTLRIVMNATDKNANKAVKSADLPMNASRAADLFLTALLTSNIYTPFGKQFNPSILRNANWTEPSVRSTLRADQKVAAAKTSGLLPPQLTASESTKREWLVDHLWTLFNAHGVDADNVSLSNIGVEFAHVDLSPSLSLDAMTWEIDIDPKILTTRLARDNTTRNYNSKMQCGPWPAICSFPRLEDDDPVVVHAFAACVNLDGSETLMSLPEAINTTDYAVDCPQQSNTSMILLTASKRLVADSLSQNSSVDPSNAFDSSTPYPVTTNLRKILSFTVSRLDWRPEDLATKYHADCLSGACTGLDVALSDGQRVIVGTNALLTGLLTPINYQLHSKSGDLRPFPLVRLIEPPPTKQMEFSWSVVAGDLLLPHNVRNLTWDLTPRPLSADKANECEVPREDRQQLVLNNHMYIEAPLQTTYTAALFFLFQNGVVRDKVAMNKQTETLTFDGNVLNLSLWVSIPFRNAVITCIGCFFLVIGCVSAIVWSSDGPSDDSDTMHSIKTPHVIARVMMDDNSFPPSLVRRRVVADGMGNVGAESSGVDRFYIESLVLESREKSDANVNHV